MNRLADSKNSFEAIFESGKKNITKGSLRKHILHIFRTAPRQHDANGNSINLLYPNLSRLDCHILVKMLFYENKIRIKQERNPSVRKELKENHDRINTKQLFDLIGNSKL